MQNKGNASKVLMGGWPSQASMENSIEMPQKDKNKSTVWQI